MNAQAHNFTPAAPPATDPLLEAWRTGARAFAAGELPPADPDQAEGWYFAENAAARLAGLPAYLVIPGSTRDPASPAEARAIAGGWSAVTRWALPRILAGTAAIAAVLFAIALIAGGH